MKKSNIDAWRTAVWEHCGQEYISRAMVEASVLLIFWTKCFRFFGEGVLHPLEKWPIAISIGLIVLMFYTR